MEKPFDILQPLLPKTTLHYSGHMMAAAGENGRIQAENEATLSERIEQAIIELDPGAAFGALASGSDILIAEHLINRNIDLHIVLPFATSEFIDTSVRPAGERWVERFHACMKKAKSIGFLTEQAYLGDDILFGIGAKLAMGKAILHARHISGATQQLAIWDRHETNGFAGTSSDIAEWTKLGNSTYIVDVADLGKISPKPVHPANPSSSQGTRVEVAMLFGDVKGFSKLTDTDLPHFVQHVLGAINTSLQDNNGAPNFINTWGDGIFAAWDNPGEAAKQALLIQDAIEELAFKEMRLPTEMSLRISLHYGVAHKLIDPILKQENYFGEAVARAARIEPITPPGGIYTTEQFASMIMLETDCPVVAEYVGHIAVAKDYGNFPLYRLRWKNISALN